MTTETDLLPLPPLRIAPSVEPVDYPSVAQALMDYAHANVAHAVAPLQAEIETLLAELDIRDSIIATHAADTREYKKRISQAEARAERLAELLDQAYGHVPAGALADQIHCALLRFALTIADATLSKENSND